MFSLKKQVSEYVPGAVLLLQVPRTNEIKELAAEQMFAALHGLLTSPVPASFFSKPEHERISFEIAVQNKRIGFYVWVPDVLKSFVEEQIYAQYPTVSISEVTDYTLLDIGHHVEVATTLKFAADNALPIKTFPSFEVDPLASITATLAQFEDNEEAWLQFVLRPAPSDWHKRSEKYASDLRKGGGGGISGAGLARALWTPPGESSGAAKLADHESTRAAAAEAKSQKLAYEITARIVYRGHGSSEQARLRLQAITASFKQFNTTYLNGFASTPLTDDPAQLVSYRERVMNRSGFICNIEEAASLYHLPHTNVETPNILWANAKTAEPPANLPVVGPTSRDTVSAAAATNFRGQSVPWGFNRADRGRHMYIIGQTGVGKSGLLELLTIADISSPYGFAVIDPHGDYAIGTLKRIPPERAADVVYFNPADVDFPVAFNPMEVTDATLKTHTASELIGVLKRMFESWGPRLEYILRYSLLALLDYPDATMLDITRILTDKKFREEVLTYVEDPVVSNFWKIEFASWTDKFAAEAVAPVLNKVGAFTANPIVRNIIGQPKSSFNIRKIMDERKILIVNLSRGLIGEDNASLLGALLVTKVQMAAMGRADQAQADRIPFYLYVDEFQNFATDSFATILSEARKYALNLTVANQYTAQMSIEVRDAVFGNVGSIVSFRTSADDARIMQKYFEPHFDEHDIVHMHNRHFATSMIIDGEKVAAFSATTMPLPEQGLDYSQAIIENSRHNFAASRSNIELFMNERYGGAKQAQNNPKPANNRPKNEQKQAPKPQQPKPQPAPAPTLQPLPPEPAPVVKAEFNPEGVPQPNFEIDPVIRRSDNHKKAAQNVLKLTSNPPQELEAAPAAVSTDESAPKTKRKRTRSRRKKTGASDAPAQAPAKQEPAQHAPQPAPKPASASDKPQSLSDDGTVIHLR